MGIKGIYKEIGPGRRESLCKLAVEHLEKTGRPLRLGIDISIWQFQVQAAKGGPAPAIRTLFYRLTRLLSLGIDALFVFDGPHKPAFKRHRRSARAGGDRVADAAARRLISLFGFAAHDAPGEAEAECALLQRAGVVDAVLSEDVDTIMFGCGRTLRAWSADVHGGSGSVGPNGTAPSGPPTHVSVFDAEAVARGDGGNGTGGLSRQGMVLVALMSGGDYLPGGVPGCGPKVACEAARAGFGAELCAIKTGGSSSSSSSGSNGNGNSGRNEALDAWRTRLSHELRTNASGVFRTRHPALRIPDDFPDLDVLRYYTHPVVSGSTTVDRLRRERDSDLRSRGVDIQGLGDFTRETFDWTGRAGIAKFARVMAPALLVQKLLAIGRTSGGGNNYNNNRERESSSNLVRAISSRRIHFSTDATPELRVSYVPADVVALDPDLDPDLELGPEESEPEPDFGRGGLALNSDDEFGAEEEGTVAAMTAARKQKVFDPAQPDLAWVPESLVRRGAPLAMRDWEAGQRAKEQRAAAKAASREERARNRRDKDKEREKSSSSKTRKSKTRDKDMDMESGVLDTWASPLSSSARLPPLTPPPSSSLSPSFSRTMPSPPPSRLPSFRDTDFPPNNNNTTTTNNNNNSKPPASKKPSSRKTRKPPESIPLPSQRAADPWTAAASLSSLSSPSNTRVARITKPKSSSSLGLPDSSDCGATTITTKQRAGEQQESVIIISSSPPATTTFTPAPALNTPTRPAVSTTTASVSIARSSVAPCLTNVPAPAPAPHPFFSPVSSCVDDPLVESALPSPSISASASAAKKKGRKDVSGTPRRRRRGIGMGMTPGQRSIEEFIRVTPKGTRSTVTGVGKDRDIVAVAEYDAVSPPSPSPLAAVKQQQLQKAGKKEERRNEGKEVEIVDLLSSDDDDDGSTKTPVARRLFPAAAAPPRSRSTTATTTLPATVKPSRGQQEDEDEKQGQGEEIHEKETTMTRLYIQRGGGPSGDGDGYFAEVEVDSEQARRMVEREGEGACSSNGNGSRNGRGEGGGMRIWRYSEVCFVDLTGD